jgi:hypothetical protein
MSPEVHVVHGSSIGAMQTRILVLELLQGGTVATAVHNRETNGDYAGNSIALLEVELFFSPARMNSSQSPIQVQNFGNNASDGRFPAKALGGSIADTLRQSAAMHRCG